jgi:hypothetical protein
VTDRLMRSEDADAPATTPVGGASGSQPPDVGARVWIMRNLEFSAGGRSHRLSRGSWSHRRPVFDPKSGRIHVGTALDSSDGSVGKKSPVGGEPAMPEHIESAARPYDASSGDTSPDRRRDKHTP